MWTADGLTTLYAHFPLPVLTLLQTHLFSTLSLHITVPSCLLQRSIFSWSLCCLSSLLIHRTHLCRSSLPLLPPFIFNLLSLLIPSYPFLLGCPRNNQMFFSVRTETNPNSICFSCFSVCFAKLNNFFSVCFGLFRCFGQVFKQPKQTEKISKKQISIRVSSKQLIFFSVRTETNWNSTCFNCFSLCFFRETKQNFFRFVSVFRTGIETT